MPYSSKEVLRKLFKAGFIGKRQTGSHKVLRHPDSRQTYVSIHTKDIPIGIFKKIPKQAKIAEKEIKDL